MEKSKKKTSEHDRMYYIMEQLKPAAEALRAACDHAEEVVADELWPLPKYREMLLANSLT
jgi:glutamine synthetase